MYTIPYMVLLCIGIYISLVTCYVILNVTHISYIIYNIILSKYIKYIKYIYIYIYIYYNILLSNTCDNITHPYYLDMLTLITTHNSTSPNSYKNNKC